MKILIIVVVTFFISFKSFSQTAIIAHRSHSGNNKTFTIKGDDNWGLPSHGQQERMKEEKARQDSILKAKTNTISKTKTTAKKTITCRKCKSKKNKKITH